MGVVFLDEFGQAEDDVKKAAAELVLHGRGRELLACPWAGASSPRRTG